MDNRAIGVFDSGLGGLTAAQELLGLLPYEHIIYLGDSYNMPYGEKPQDKIIEMSRRNLQFLLEKDVKAVFVACGTATSNALEILIKESPVPVFGVVEPAVREAVECTKNGNIGLLATKASVRAGTYEELIKKLAPEISVTAKACPKFATMVEDGIFDKDDIRVYEAVQEYLPPLKFANVDTIILGCTHYPLLSDVISEYMGGKVRLISAGAAAARSICSYLCKNGMTAEREFHKTEYYTTGDFARFAHTAQLMLKRDISSELIEIEPFDQTQNM
ncbi:MAG: glutamate racemase [Clostridiales bacterium]|nr:glutamate racemase [Clostridiales bacterium]